MTKKHFEYAAASVRKARASGKLKPREVAAVIAAFASLFQAFNPAFDEARFTDACLRDEVTS